MDSSSGPPSAAFMVQQQSSSPVLREYRSPFRTWVWVCFWVNAVIATIFAILCALVYQSFTDAINSLGDVQADSQLGVSLSDWQALFWGAAVSAIFAFVISVLFHVGTLLLLMCSFKSLGHPGRRFGRAFVIAAAFFTSLHILNITLQFSSFAPVMATLNSQDSTGFNTKMLTACIALGYMTFVLYLVYATLVTLWKERPELLQVHVPGSSSSATV